MAWFFPTTTADEDRAIATCRTCPVVTACLQFAVEHDQMHGVWGGTTEAQRRAHVRTRGRASHVA
jgi:WhiB family transcriptional regulator, redox-sensing transcriptional regulator